jgi:GNAT superfamily N-acetyltransferase
MAITENYAFLGALGTLPEARGKGLAGRLLAQIAGEMAGRETWLSCREELRGFYASVGFEHAGEMVALRWEDNL